MCWQGNRTSVLVAAYAAGIIVLNAHRVTDTNGEGFAIRLFRAGNTGGYVRAFSDVPTALAGGFNKVRCLVHCLCVLQHSDL
jgi:DNA excision repair protein ERCC-4